MGLFIPHYESFYPRCELLACRENKILSVCRRYFLTQVVTENMSQASEPAGHHPWRIDSLKWIQLRVFLFFFSPLALIEKHNICTCDGLCRSPQNRGLFRGCVCSLGSTHFKGKSVKPKCNLNLNPPSNIHYRGQNITRMSCSHYRPAVCWSSASFLGMHSLSVDLNS